MGTIAMCLKIDNSVTLPPPTNKKNLIKGYKVVQLRMFGGPYFRSSFYKYRWKIGWNESGRKSENLDVEEIQCNQVYEGFHVYKEKPPHSLDHIPLKIIVVYFKPEDLVAKGIEPINVDGNIIIEVPGFVVMKLFVEKDQLE